MVEGHQRIWSWNEPNNGSTFLDKGWLHKAQSWSIFIILPHESIIVTIMLLWWCRDLWTELKCLRVLLKTTWAKEILFLSIRYNMACKQKNFLETTPVWKYFATLILFLAARTLWYLWVYEWGSSRGHFCYAGKLSCSRRAVGFLEPVHPSIAFQDSAGRRKSDSPQGTIRATAPSW